MKFQNQPKQDMLTTRKTFVKIMANTQKTPR